MRSLKRLDLPFYLDNGFLKLATTGVAGIDQREVEETIGLLKKMSGCECALVRHFRAEPV